MLYCIIPMGVQSTMYFGWREDHAKAWRTLVPFLQTLKHTVASSPALTTSTSAFDLVEME